MSFINVKHTAKGTTYNIKGIKIKMKDFYLPVNRQKAPTIHFIHVCEPRNPGDMLCYPYLYFKKYFNHFNCQIHHTKDIKFESVKTRDVVILASGGCFEVLDQFQESINRLLDMCDNVISWGCGHNAHQGRDIYWPIEFHKFKLLSVRDYNYPGQRYVPCVSCMQPALTQTYALQRRVGIVEHQDFPIDVAGDKINHIAGFDTLIDFIGSSEIILTNTYHCAYWAMCMSKKVILYQPFSTKFKYFKHHPPVYSGDLETDILATIPPPPAFLDECRTLNLDFFQDVKKLIHNVMES